MPGTRKLGKTTDQRMAMLRQQVTDFLDKGKMETTVTRAKEIKPLAEKMITLGKTSDQRMAMLRQQVTDFLDNGKMETTITRAKEIKPMAEKMITLGKKADLAAYRQAMSFITREDVCKKIFKEIAPKYAERNGGYTRIIRTGIRRGDAAETAIIELV